MTLEEAAEIVLKAQPWLACTICKGRGFTVFEMDKPVACQSCHGAGFSTTPDIEEAYRITGVELPTKPLSALEAAAEMTQELREAMNRPSATRRLFSPVHVHKTIIDDPLKDREPW